MASIIMHDPINIDIPYIKYSYDDKNIEHCIHCGSPTLFRYLGHILFDGHAICSRCLTEPSTIVMADMIHRICLQ